MDDQLLSGKRVLIVEDEMLVLMAIEDMLSDLGCTSFMGASTVETALNLIAANKFDLATVDLNLNGTRSYPIACELDDRHIPFAFATGYGQQGVGEEYSDRPVLHKPFGLFEFEKIVRELLADGVPPALAPLGIGASVVGRAGEDA